MRIKILLIAAVLLFTSCTEQPEMQAVSEPPAPPPYPDINYSMDAAIDALKQADFDTLPQYIDMPSELDFFAQQNDVQAQLENTDNSEYIELYKQFFRSLDYEVTAVEQTGDTAAATVVFTTVDGSALAKTLVQEAVAEFAADMLLSSAQPPTQEELQLRFTELITEALQNDDIPLTEKTVEVNFTKGDEHWIITADEHLADAISGDLLTTGMDMYENFSNLIPQS